MTFYMVSMYHKTTHLHVWCWSLPMPVYWHFGRYSLGMLAQPISSSYIPSSLTRCTVTFHRSGSTACHDLFYLLVSKRNLPHVLDLIQANAYSQTGSEAKYRIRVV